LQSDDNEAKEEERKGEILMDPFGQATPNRKKFDDTADDDFFSKIPSKQERG